MNAQSEYRVSARFWDRGASRANACYVIERRLSGRWVDGNTQAVTNARGGIRKFWAETNAVKAMKKLSGSAA